jgi:hypothetical protein
MGVHSSGRFWGHSRRERGGPHFFQTSPVRETDARAPSRWRGGCLVKGSASKVPVARGPVFYPELPAPALDRFRGDNEHHNAFICDCQRQYWYNYSVKAAYTSVPQYIRRSRAVLFCLISCRYWRAHGGGWRRAEALGSVRWVASVDCPCFASTASDRRKSSPQARFRHHGNLASNCSMAYWRSISVTVPAGSPSRSIRIVPPAKAMR